MHDFPIAGPGLGHLHILVLFKVGRRIEVLILVGTGGLDRIRFWHLYNHIRLADTPAFDELRGGRQVFRIAFFRSAVYPGGNGIDLSLRKAWIIGPLTDARVGVPRRHLSTDDLLFDRSCPRPHVLVAEDRERRGFARAMALGTALEEDGRDL